MNWRDQEIGNACPLSLNSGGQAGRPGTDDQEVDVFVLRRFNHGHVEIRRNFWRRLTLHFTAGCNQAKARPVAEPYFGWKLRIGGSLHPCFLLCKLACSVRPRISGPATLSMVATAR